MKSTASPRARIAALQHIDPRWAWHHCALLRLRQSLLHGQSGLPAESESCPADHEHASTHEAVLTELLPPEERLPEIDAALARIRAHAFGLCDATGAAIPAARLRAMPWTRFAIPASERRIKPQPT